MKLKLLIPLLVFLFVSEAGNACPVYLKGKIKVVDEYNKIIPNAIIWGYSSLNDSFKIRKKFNYRRNSDTNTYYIYTSGGWNIWGWGDEDYKYPDKEYLITAEGYATLIVKGVYFKWEEGDTVVPTLIITMYGQKYKKVNNSIALYDKFVVNETVEVKDTVRLKWKDYVGDEDDISNGFGKEVFTKVTTYPNPVVKGLHIKINYAITSPLTAKISDVQGKLIEEIRIENNEVDWDLQWHKKGSYFLTVYDETNKPIHTQLIVKQ